MHFRFQMVHREANQFRRRLKAQFLTNIEQENDKKSLFYDISYIYELRISSARSYWKVREVFYEKK